MGWVSGLWCGWVSSQPGEVDLTHTASAASPQGFIFDLLGLCIPRAPCSRLPVPVRHGLGEACSELT